MGLCEWCCPSRRPVSVPVLKSSLSSFFFLPSFLSLFPSCCDGICPYRQWELWDLQTLSPWLLYRVYFAASGLSCGRAKSFATGSWLRCADFSLIATLGLSSCCIAWGLWNLNSRTRDQTHIPGTGRRILNPWTLRGVLEVADCSVLRPSTPQLPKPAASAPRLPELTRAKDHGGTRGRNAPLQMPGNPHFSWFPALLLSALSLAIGDALKISPGTCSISVSGSSLGITHGPCENVSGCSDRGLRLPGSQAARSARPPLAADSCSRASAAQASQRLCGSPIVRVTTVTALWAARLPTRPGAWEGGPWSSFALLARKAVPPPFFKVLF